ncbi:hypothetical protein MLD38_002331 [Melastoma candidum]|uniref:Uncharacterized protein n=1 Tax=Melastoma candidum TaxID=119954 RepID=A0ACB9S0J6_9MYRT|nr:hypothetical protein MLD38_002331 [Melastoma candidum]
MVLKLLMILEGDKAIKENGAQSTNAESRGKRPPWGLVAVTGSSWSGFEKSIALLYSGQLFHGNFSGHLFQSMPEIGTRLIWGSNDFKGLYGYKVFIAISLILGDGLHNLIKIIGLTLMEVFNKSSKMPNLPIVMESLGNNRLNKFPIALEQRKRDKVFLKDKIPLWFALSGYVGLAAVSTARVSMIFPSLRWYLVLRSYIIAPALAFCNSYGTGLTDWSLASTYGKIGLFMIASMVGSNGGIIAGLTACGAVMSSVFNCCRLDARFQDRLLNIILNEINVREPASGNHHGLCDSPTPFLAALAINLLRDVTPKKLSQFIPIPMAMADLSTSGHTLQSTWTGIWTIPSAILSIFRTNSPICMCFGPSGGR